MSLSNTLVPEFSVSDWSASRSFYVQVLGFSVLYERLEEGFSYLKLGGAELMIDQIGAGRTFDDGHLPVAQPFGRGLNVQISVPDADALADRVRVAGLAFYLEPETRWYRRDAVELGQRQFVVADPDGYLLRFCHDVGGRPAQG